LQSREVHSTDWEQSPLAHATAHESAALHWIAPEHALVPVHWIEHVAALHVTPPEQVLLPQWTVQLVPAQTTPPEHVFGPHSMSQLAAFEQSTRPAQPVPDVPHCTTHSTPAGHTTPDAHLPAQSMTQRPALSHAPFGHDCVEHATPEPGPVADDGPQAPRNTSAQLQVPDAVTRVVRPAWGMRVRPRVFTGKSVSGPNARRMCRKSRQTDSRHRRVPAVSIVSTARNRTLPLIIR
jgi:hypothetical protein